MQETKCNEERKDIKGKSEEASSSGRGTRLAAVPLVRVQAASECVQDKDEEEEKDESNSKRDDQKSGIRSPVRNKQDGECHLKTTAQLDNYKSCVPSVILIKTMH